jgi:hypothetical protein
VAKYCAPRLDEGYEVEAVRRRIALRAGLAWEETTPSVGQLRGYIDRIAPHVIAGWAQNADHPEAPVCLDILVGGRLVGQVLANRYREDLKKAGIGSGHHSFKFAPPSGLMFAPETVEVRRSIDGAVIDLSVAARRVLPLSPPSSRASIQRRTPAASAPNIRVYRRRARVRC